MFSPGDDAAFVAKRLPDLEIAAYRVIQEALTNVARHSGADQASVRLEVKERALSITVKDKGNGFNVKQAGEAFSSGLSGMRERAVFLGGSFQIKSSPGKGCTISVVLPIT